MQQEKKVTLAPSGVSPWTHQVSIENGQLALWWHASGDELVRTFTHEETKNLLQFLTEHKAEIGKPKTEAEDRNEQYVRECLQELKARKLALIPSSVSALIKQKNLMILFPGGYEEITRLTWKVLDDPAAEQAYNRIIAKDE